MSTMTISTPAAIAGITILVATALIVIRVYRSSRIRPRVLVVTRSGETIRGALLHRRRDRVEIGGAELLEQGKATPIDGITYIDRNNIRWMQEPPT